MTAAVRCGCNCCCWDGGGRRQLQLDENATHGDVAEARFVADTTAVASAAPEMPLLLPVFLAQEPLGARAPRNRSRGGGRNRRRRC